MDDKKNTNIPEYEPNFTMREPEPSDNLQDTFEDSSLNAKAIREARAKARMAEESRRAEEAQRAAEAHRQAQAQMAEQARRAAEAQRQAEVQRQAEQRAREERIAEARRAAEAQAQADAERAAYQRQYSQYHAGQQSFSSQQSHVGGQHSSGSQQSFSGQQSHVGGQHSSGSQQSHVGGSYEDPRHKFRNGDSSSWTNGEVVINKVKKKKKERKPAAPVMLTKKALAGMIAGCLALSCLCGFGGVMAGTAISDGNTAQQTQVTAPTANAKNAGYTLENATGSALTVKEITSKCQPSVVEIKTESVASDSWMQQYVTKGAGSGVIISEDGYIMTNNHVIDGANSITVTTSDEKEYEAKLVGTDTIGDIAVIKIDATGLTAATYGNSDQLEVGDMAVAIGNPLGELGGTVTAGIISATDRELSIDGKSMTLLQTDSSINPGNSGGGLFNGEGQLIGIVVAKSSGSDVEGLGFAIPINTAAEKAQQLMDNGYVKGQPWTGMAYTEGSTNSGFSFFGGDTGVTNVYIARIDSKEAKAAGFQEGDMVFAIDDQQITCFDDLSSIITSHKVGDKVKFTIVRDQQTMEIKLKLQERKATVETQEN